MTVLHIYSVKFVGMQNPHFSRDYKNVMQICNVVHTKCLDGENNSTPNAEPLYTAVEIQARSVLCSIIKIFLMLVTNVIFMKLLSFAGACWGIGKVVVLVDVNYNLTLLLFVLMNLSMFKHLSLFSLPLVSVICIL